MCIAIYSPMGNEVPCENYLKSSFERNDDGAGFAFNDNGEVTIIKGLMDWNSFIKTFRKYEKKFDFKNRGVLIHFRISTHGGTNPECTHPFPLVADEGIMHKLQYKTKYAVIHNGIISLTSSETYHRNKMSDTMVFIEKYLTKLATNNGWFENESNFELIYDMIDSKMAVLSGNGKIMSTAGFVKDEDGNYYSNTSYKESRSLKTSTNRCYSGGYGWNDYWDDYDDYYGYGSSYTNNNSKTTKKDESDNDEYYYYNNEGDKVCYRRIRLMKLKPGQVVVFDEGDIEFNDILDNEIVLVDNSGFVYLGYKKYGQTAWVDIDKMDLVGSNAEVYDTLSYDQIEFVPEMYSYETILQPTDKEEKSVSKGEKKK